MMGLFFGAMFTNDLTFLNDGGVLSGEVLGSEFAFTSSDGSAQMLNGNEIGTIFLSEGNAQVSMSTGQVLTGRFETDTLSIISPEGETVSVALTDVSMVMMSLANTGGIEVEEEVSDDGETVQRSVMIGGHGLQAQNMFAQFAKALSSYDLLVYGNQQLWSGTVLNEQITFHSNSFGTLTVNAADLGAIELGQNAEEGQDFITLKVGDRVSGTLDEGSAIQFQPIGFSDDGGNPFTITLERGQVRQVAFKAPASAFGSGGRGPGLGGGPGH